MRFRYEGHDRFAKASHGTVEAATEGDACQALREKGIFAMKVAPEGEAFRTVLPGNQHNPPVAIQPPPRQATSAILNQPAPQPAPQVDPVEAELFGAAPTKQDVVAQAAGPAQVEGRAILSEQARPQELEGWKQELLEGIESASLVLRQIHEWHAEYKKALDEQRPAAGPQVGGKTWAFVEANLEAASREMIMDALRSSAITLRATARLARLAAARSVK
jgi:hypothetical protein